MYKLSELFNQAESFADYIKLYNARLAEVLEGISGEAMTQAMEILDKARNDNKAIYLIGNGGSAGLASHIVNDMVAGAYQEGKPALRAFSLTDNVSTVTALGNDCGYESIFLNQLKVYLQPGDVVLAMSVSGNSPNIIRALRYAKEHGAATIGICGFTGGSMIGISDVSIHIPATLDEYGPVEDAFGIIGHIMAGYLSMKQGKMLHH